DQNGVWLFSIGVDAGKDTVMSRLKAGKHQSGYCHFPLEPEKGYDEEYFKGLTSEHKVTRYRHGQSYHRWEKKFSGARNEPFDLRNYATAALEILNPRLDEIKNRLVGKEKLVTKKKKRRRVLSKGVK